MVTYDVDGAIITNAPVVFIGTSFPTTGTALVNAGTGSTTYNGTANANRHVTAKSGCDAWKTTATSDYISVPHGAAIDNFTYLTIEIGFYLDSIPSQNTMLVSKDASGGCGWSLYMKSTGILSLWRDDGTCTYWRDYTIPALTAGHYYYVQVTWDCSGYTNAPIFKLSTDGAARTTPSVTNASSGTTTAWYSDSSNNLYIGNYTSASDCPTYTLDFVRIHTVIVADADLTTNFNASVWRLSSSFQERTVPNVAAATTAQTLGSAVTAVTPPNVAVATTATQALTIGTPNVAVATLAPTIGETDTIAAPAPPNIAVATTLNTFAIGITESTPPNVAAAIASIAQAVGLTQPTPPNVAAATTAITIAETDTIAAPTPPNASVATTAQTLGFGITQSTPPNVAAAIVSTAQALGITQPTPPNVAAATLTPTIGETDTLTAPTPPNVSAAALALTLASAITQSTPPNVAAAIAAVTLALGITQPSQPNASVATISPVYATSSTIVPPVIPDVAVGVITPAINIGIAATVIDTAITTVIPVLGLGVTPSAPDVSAAVLLPSIEIDCSVPAFAPLSVASSAIAGEITEVDCNLTVSAPLSATVNAVTSAVGITGSAFITVGSLTAQATTITETLNADCVLSVFTPISVNASEITTTCAADYATTVTSITTNTNSPVVSVQVPAPGVTLIISSISASATAVSETTAAACVVPTFTPIIASANALPETVTQDCNLPTFSPIRANATEATTSISAGCSLPPLTTVSVNAGAVLTSTTTACTILGVSLAATIPPTIAAVSRADQNLTALAPIPTRASATTALPALQINVVLMLAAMGAYSNPSSIAAEADFQRTLAALSARGNTILAALAQQSYVHTVPLTAAAQTVSPAAKAVQWYAFRQEPGIVANIFTESENVIDSYTESERVIKTFTLAGDVENTRSFSLELD